LVSNKLKADSLKLENDAIIEKINKEPEKDLTKYKIHRRIIRIIIGLLIISICFSMIIPMKNSDRCFIIQSCLIFVLVSLYYYSFFSNLKFSYYTYTILAVLLYVIMSGFSDSYKIKENFDTEVYNLKYQDTIINTNDTLHFLGKSDSYIFLYDIKSNKSFILSTDGIKEINIKKRIK
jgi:hypothetical protein